MSVIIGPGWQSRGADPKSEHRSDRVVADEWAGTAGSSPPGVRGWVQTPMVLEGCEGVRQSPAGTAINAATERTTFAIVRRREAPGQGPVFDETPGRATARNPLG